MEKIIDGILSELNIRRTWFNDFCIKNNLDKSSYVSFKNSLTKAIEEKNNERDLLKKKNHEKTFPLPKAINPITNWGYYNSFNSSIYNGRRKNNYSPKLESLNQTIHFLNSMLLYVVDHPEKESTQTKKNENNIKNKSKYSEYGELKKLINEFINLQEFKNLKIPKHETLKVNQLNAIENLLKKEYPDFPIEKNWSSFINSLKRRDYSHSRDRKY